MILVDFEANCRTASKKGSNIILVPGSLSNLSRRARRDAFGKKKA